LHSSTDGVNRPVKSSRDAASNSEVHREGET
jgi:hypothetical protein